MSLYIFDLDGTLALIEHRLHLISEGNKRWDEFFAACVDDKPNLPVIQTLNVVARHAEVWIWSGRSDSVRDETESWLLKHASYMFGNQLKMRPHGDHQSDEKLKRGWYDALPQKDKDRIVAVFEDRNRMVAMWRSLGIACFQVAPGDF